MKRGRRGGSILPAILVGLLSFAITVEWRAQAVSSNAVEGRRAELAAAVTSRQDRAADLEKRLLELRAQIASASTATGQASLVELHALTDELAIVVGTASVSGPGIAVTLTDAPPGDRAANAADSRIQDVDVQAVVNALWSAGAEAISVNGERIVATTAIRNAGQTVLINYHVVASPYAISAIGPPTMPATFGGSEIAHRFRGWQEIYGLGFHIETMQSIVVPAFGGSIRFRFARPIAQG